MRLMPILLGLFICWPVLGQTYTISTVAGNGKPGFSGDKGPAINAQLSNPYAVAVDAAGNLYIADYRRY